MTPARRGWESEADRGEEPGGGEWGAAGTQIHSQGLATARMWGSGPRGLWGREQNTGS